jgi:hypothetical protein
VRQNGAPAHYSITTQCPAGFWTRKGWPNDVITDAVQARRPGVRGDAGILRNRSRVPAHPVMQTHRRPVSGWRAECFALQSFALWLDPDPPALSLSPLRL